MNAPARSLTAAVLFLAFPARAGGPIHLTSSMAPHKVQAIAGAISVRGYDTIQGQAAPVISVRTFPAGFSGLSLPE
jgi:hypothetical protein